MGRKQGPPSGGAEGGADGEEGGDKQNRGSLHEWLARLDTNRYRFLVIVRAFAEESKQEIENTFTPPLMSVPLLPSFVLP